MLYFDRLLTTCLGEGTGMLLPSITAPIDGVVTPQSKYPDNTLVEYVIDNATQWERGIGYFSASGTQFNRAGVFASTNSDALVSFTAGTKTLFVTPLAKTLGRLSIGRDRSYRSGRGPAPAGGTDHITINPGVGDEIVLDTPGWHCVARPTGAKSLKGTITGGAGGGGGGEGGADSSNRNGGGGGGSSGTSRFGYRAEKLPFIWVYIGNGGLGGAGGVSNNGVDGSPGELSYVCTHQDTTAQCRLAVSGGAAATAGLANGNGGNASTVASDTDAPLSQGADCLEYSCVAGRAGSQGQSGIDVTDTTLGTGCPTVGGTGAGGLNTVQGPFAGGDITGVEAAGIPTQAGGPGTSGTSSSTCGWEAGLYVLGGTGAGATSNNATGFAGGDGVYGSGGGGGAGARLTTGGKGGNGGNGRCYLIWT